MLSTPRPAATEIGVLSTRPPSVRACPSMVTGGRIPGRLALARTASAAGACRSTISRPVAISVATTTIGIAASWSRS